MFPPGRARLATKPLPTGSGSCAMTMGIVTVASLAAPVTGGLAETMMSTLRRTSSAASAGKKIIEELYELARELEKMEKLEKQ
jgi:hypothetical protein